MGQNIFDLSAKRFCLEDAGAEVSGGAEAGFRGACLQQRMFFCREPEGDAGGFVGTPGERWFDRRRRVRLYRWWERFWGTNAAVGPQCLLIADRGDIVGERAQIPRICRSAGATGKRGDHAGEGGAVSGRPVGTGVGHRASLGCGFATMSISARKVERSFPKPGRAGPVGFKMEWPAMPITARWGAQAFCFCRGCQFRSTGRTTHRHHPESAARR